MRSQSGKRRAQPRPRKVELNDIKVRRYLEQRPDFLEENPDLLGTLIPPEYPRGEGVIDFQRYMVKRLQGHVRDLDDFQSRLVEATRSNFTNQIRVHSAVLMLLEASSAEELAQLITSDWTELLGVDVISIAFEESTAGSAKIRGIGQLPDGWIEANMAEENALILRGDIIGADEIFGRAAPLVRAEALVRLNGRAGTPQGLLAFGSREAESFYPGQGTELLKFVGQVVERMFAPWLKRSN